MANAVGYEGKQRTELRVDVNRDFAFDTGAKDCMRSVAARALNELWRRHVFQLAVTFHGGMLAVACERAAVARARGARAARARRGRGSKLRRPNTHHASRSLALALSLAQGTSGARPRTRRRAAPT